jgi:hypothetical protein
MWLQHQAGASLFPADPACGIVGRVAQAVFSSLEARNPSFASVEMSVFEICMY